LETPQGGGQKLHWGGPVDARAKEEKKRGWLGGLFGVLSEEIRGSP